MKRVLPPLTLLLLSLPGLVCTPSHSAAQEIRWYTDYAVARQDAEKLGKPIILDFGTKNCFWCRRLESDTFTDPTVARTMGEKFINMKIDAEEQPALAERLRITSYPTIVLADADGRILGTMEGFKEPAAFQEILQRALARVANPEWMVRDYQAASQAVAASDYTKAIALLRRILEDGKTRPVQVKSRQLYTQVEQQADGLLARATGLNDKGQAQEATNILTQLMGAYPGTQAAGKAKTLLTSLSNTNENLAKQNRQQRARELLAQAKEDYRVEEYMVCLDRCRTLRESYRDLDESIEARQLEDNIKSNPDFMQKACNSLGERLRSMYLELAETHIQKGDRQQAMAALQRVVEAFPGSTHAEAAQIRLAELRGEPMRAINFEK